MTTIQIGDVCLDLAQGRPVHVRADTGQTVAVWSDQNDYELAENYGNSRFDTQPDDRVYDVVYCSSLKSKPSKTYAMPESRLARVETEAADDGVPVADEIRRALLSDLFDQRLRFLRAHGVDMVFAFGWEREDGESSRPLFERHGFTPIQPFSDYYATEGDRSSCPDCGIWRGDGGVCSCETTFWALDGASETDEQPADLDNGGAE